MLVLRARHISVQISRKSEIMAFISHSFSVNIVVVDMFSYPFFLFSFLYLLWHIKSTRRKMLATNTRQKKKTKWNISCHFLGSALICNRSDQANIIFLIYFCQHKYNFRIFILKRCRIKPRNHHCHFQMGTKKNVTYISRWCNVRFTSSPFTFYIILKEIQMLHIKTLRKKKFYLK